MITQKRLKELLHYNPDTGIFTRKIKTSNRINIGDVAGGKDLDGYLTVSLDGSRYRTHRLVFLHITGSIPEFVDHIDHNRQNNLFSNLRPATRYMNQQNLSMRKDNKSNFTGVCKHKNAWIARINVKNVQINLGRFKNKQDAINSRLKANKKYGFHKNHGEKV